MTIKARAKAKTRILEAVHEGASDLHRLGFICKRKMRKFDDLCLKSIPGYNGAMRPDLRGHVQEA